MIEPPPLPLGWVGGQSLMLRLRLTLPPCVLLEIEDYSDHYSDNSTATTTVTTLQRRLQRRLQWRLQRRPTATTTATTTVTTTVTALQRRGLIRRMGLPLGQKIMSPQEEETRKDSSTCLCWLEEGRGRVVRFRSSTFE